MNDQLPADLELLAQFIPVEPINSESHEWYAWKKLEEAYERLHSVLSHRVYTRLPEMDKRIRFGDDFAGDAWICWVAVGADPNTQ